MARWKRVATVNGPRYLDAPLSKGWLDALMAATTPEELAKYDGLGAVQQRSRALWAWRCLGMAFKALNVVPMSTAAYQDAWRSAFAANGLELTPVPVGGGGWIVDRAARIFDSTHPGRSPADTDAWARLGLSREGDVLSPMLDVQNPGEFNLTGGWSGRSMTEGSETCPSVGDWRCTNWRAPPLQRAKIAPAVRWFVELARMIGGAVLSAGPEVVAGTAGAVIRSGEPAELSVPAPPGFSYPVVSSIPLPPMVFTPPPPPSDDGQSNELPKDMTPVSPGPGQTPPPGPQQPQGGGILGPVVLVAAAGAVAWAMTRKRP